jgi:hypothetical protein
MGIFILITNVPKKHHFSLLAKTLRGGKFNLSKIKSEGSPPLYKLTINQKAQRQAFLKYSSDLESGVK